MLWVRFFSCQKVVGISGTEAHEVIHMHKCYPSDFYIMTWNQGCSLCWLQNPWNLQQWASWCHAPNISEPTWQSPIPSGRLPETDLLLPLLWGLRGVTAPPLRGQRLGHPGRTTGVPSHDAHPGCAIVTLNWLLSPGSQARQLAFAVLSSLLTWTQASHLQIQ